MSDWERKRRALFYLEASSSVLAGGVDDIEGLGRTASVRKDTLYCWFWQRQRTPINYLRRLMDEFTPRQMLGHYGMVFESPGGQIYGPGVRELRRLATVERAKRCIVTEEYMKRRRKLEPTDSGFSYQRLGARQLDGHRERDVFTVFEDGEAPNWPALSMVKVQPPSDRLIGRRRELDSILDKLCTDRWLTIWGTAGVGKTRLAKEAALRWRRTRPEGSAVFVEIEGRELPPGDVMAAIAHAVSSSSSASSESQLLELVGSVLDKYGPSLLVLDNIEQNIEAVTQIGQQLLEVTDDSVRVLCTSRQPLEFSGESVFEVESFSEKESLFLFEEKLKNHRGDSTPGLDNFDAETALLDQTQGLPLAVELLAARATTTSLSELAESLDSCSPIQGYDEKINHTIEWSWALMNEVEKRILKLCSVFRNTFSSESVGEVFQDQIADLESPDGESLDLESIFETLWRSSLIRTEKVEGGTVWYRMYHPVRRFCLDQLGTRELERLRDRYVSYCVARSKKLNDELKYGDENWAHRKFRLESKDLLYCLDWALERDDLRGAELVANLTEFQADQRPVSGWGPRLESAIQLVEPSESEQLLARLELCRAKVLAATGKLSDAAASLEAMLQTNDSSDWSDSVSLEIRRLLGSLYRRMGEFERATDYLCEGIRMLDGESPIAFEAHFRSEFGFLEKDRGQYLEAKGEFERAAELGDRVGQITTKRAALQVKGEIAQINGDLDRALELWQQALELATRAGNDRRIAEHLLYVGSAYLQKGKERQGKNTLFRALEQAHRLGLDLIVSAVYGNLGQFYLWDKQPDKASYYVRKAIDKIENKDWKWMRVQVLIYLPLLECLEGRTSSARASLRDAQKLKSEIEYDHDWFDGLFAMVERVVEFAEALESGKSVQLEAVERDIEAIADPHRDNARFQSNLKCVRSAIELILEHSSSDIVTENAMAITPGIYEMSPPGKTEWVPMSGRGPIRRTLQRLVEDRIAHPGEPVPNESLFEAGWPDVDHTQVNLQNRLWMAISELRDLGLDSVIKTVRGTGYIIPQSIPVQRVDSSEVSLDE